MFNRAIYTMTREEWLESYESFREKLKEDAQAYQNIRVKE